MRVCHPNIAEVREFGEDDGTLFYVTEFVDGETLDNYLARCNPLPPWLAGTPAPARMTGDAPSPAPQEAPADA